MARRVGISPAANASRFGKTAVSRIWRAFGLRPHRAETFKLSSDPAFVEKVRDVVGLYLAPPDRALVLCLDEKPQIQAAQGAAPAFPMRPGQAERSTHDYRRHGTLDLFAMLDAQAGKVIGACKRRHRSTEFRAFLDQIERSVPPDLDGHLVLDNLKTYKTRLIHDWLLKRPRFHLYFTPTSASRRKPPVSPGSTWSSAGSCASTAARASASSTFQATQQRPPLNSSPPRSRRAGRASRRTSSSRKSWGWTTTRGAPGAACTTTRCCAKWRSRFCNPCGSGEKGGAAAVKPHRPAHRQNRPCLHCAPTSSSPCSAVSPAARTADARHPGIRSCERGRAVPKRRGSRRFRSNEPPAHRSHHARGRNVLVDRRAVLADVANVFRPLGIGVDVQRDPAPRRAGHGPGTSLGLG